MTSVNPYDTPASEVIEKEELGSLLIFSRFSAWFVFLLNLVTLGLYGYIWLYIRTQSINTFSKNRISEILIYFTIGLYAGSFGLGVLTGVIEVPRKLVVANGWSNMLIFILHIIWLFAFRSRLASLLHHRKTIGLHASGILTFFFGSIYLQYKINEGLDALNDEIKIDREEPNKTKILDTDLIVDGINFSSYTLSELRDSLANVDQKAYPARARVIRMAIERYR